MRIEELDASNESKWIAYWRKNPIAAWTGAKPNRRQWFALDSDRLHLDLELDPSLEPTLIRMMRELVDYRLAQYRARQRHRLATPDGFVCRVTWNQRDPILKLPSRAQTNLPENETDVRLPDGSVWQCRFAKEFCNVARPAGTQRNQLPDLLREWFGQQAGQPGAALAGSACLHCMDAHFERVRRLIDDVVGRAARVSGAYSSTLGGY